MALQYFFEFTDVTGVLHRVDISNEANFDPAIEIKGSCVLDYPNNDDPLESIQPSGLTLNLEASTSLTLENLYSEEERTFFVEYYIAGVKKFQGWLDPEGIFEDFVNNEWVITLQASDGLGFLQNLSFVNDTTGEIFAGRHKITKIISNALKRTKIAKDILIEIDCVYTGLAETSDVFDNTYLNVDRYVKDDGETIMNCDEVLRSILDLFSASITSRDDKWIIYQPFTLLSASTRTFFSYNSHGDPNATPTETINFAQTIGSQIDGEPIHHVNENQSKTIRSSVGAYRINFKYGFVNSIISNNILQNNGTTIDNWTINSLDDMTLNNGKVQFVWDDVTSVKNLTSTSSAVNAGDVLGLDLKFTTIENTRDPLSQLEFDGLFLFKVILSDGANTYYLKITRNGAFVLNFEWSQTDDILQWYGIGDLGITRSTLDDGYILPPSPIDGDVTIEIHGAIKDNTIQPPLTSTGTIEMHKAGLNFVSTQNNVEGENHTFQRITKPSAKIKKTKKIFNGDMKADVYFGAIYESDALTLTKTWNRKGIVEEKPIIQLMGENRLKIQHKPQIIFSGDIFGYIDPISIVTINNITGSFLISSYQYDARQNITSLTLHQILYDELTDDIQYEITYDYGKVVDPTIKG